MPDRKVTRAARPMPARLLWRIGLLVGVVGGAIVAIGLTAPAA